MGYIPAGARWYIAQHVVAISVEGARQTVVHVNSVLVRADSRKKLAVFAPRAPSRGPDYASGEIVREIEAHLKRAKPRTRRR